MKPMKNLAQYYVDLLVKLGIVRFSILLALALVALAVVVQVGITLALKGRVDDIDIVRSVFFGLLITPWAVYFLSVVVDQLEESRQRLTKLVSKLKDMRSRDQELNYQLQQNIEKLNGTFGLFTGLLHSRQVPLVMINQILQAVMHAVERRVVGGHHQGVSRQCFTKARKGGKPVRKGVGLWLAGHHANI